MITANSRSSGLSCLPPRCSRTFDGGISDSAISHSPSGTIQLHVHRPMNNPASDHHIGHRSRSHRCRRRSASRPRPRIAGSPRGPGRDCGVGSTGRSWTNSVREASWTGPRRSSMPSRSGPKKGGTLTGPNLVDGGKKGSKLHVLSEAQSIPPTVAVSGANTHDSPALKPLIRGIPAVRSRRGPRRRRPVKLRARKAYSPPNTSPGCASAGSSRASRVPGSNRIESSELLGRHR